MSDACPFFWEAEVRYATIYSRARSLDLGLTIRDSEGTLVTGVRDYLMALLACTQRFLSFI